MTKARNTDQGSADDLAGKRILMHEAYEELNEFKATKKTVTELLEYKRTLIDIENNDFEKINEIKGKAIDAINNLFNDIINTKK
jgi:hypothetical protein